MFPGQYGSPPLGGYRGYGPGNFQGGSYGPPPGPDPRLWQWFSAIDKNGSGLLEPSELQEALVNGDWTSFDFETIQLLMTMFDTDRKGSLNFNEFQGLWQYIKDWQGIFKKHDRDQSGTIDASELNNVLRGFGFNLSPERLGPLLRKYSLIGGPGGPRGLTFDRFIRCCVEIRQLNEAAQKLGPSQEKRSLVGRSGVDRIGSNPASTTTLTSSFYGAPMSSNMSITKQGVSYGPPPGADPQLWQWFSAIDANRSGSIEPDELQQALVNFDWTSFDSETIQLFMAMFDTDRKGSLSFDEFHGLWNYIKEWQGIFKRFDADQSGTIDGSELNHALRGFGFNLSPEHLDRLVRKYNPQVSVGGPRGPRGLTFDRFIRCCVEIRQLNEATQKLDPSQENIAQRLVSRLEDDKVASNRSHGPPIPSKISIIVFNETRAPINPCDSISYATVPEGANSAPPEDVAAENSGSGGVFNFSTALCAISAYEIPDTGCIWILFVQASKGERPIVKTVFYPAAKGVSSVLVNDIKDSAAHKETATYACTRAGVDVTFEATSGVATSLPVSVEFMLTANATNPSRGRNAIAMNRSIGYAPSMGRSYWSQS